MVPIVVLKKNGELWSDLVIEKEKRKKTKFM
jgi:hypothetical protein